MPHTRRLEVLTAFDKSLNGPLGRRGADTLHFGAAHVLSRDKLETHPGMRTPGDSGDKNNVVLSTYIVAVNSGPLNRHVY